LVNIMIERLMIAASVAALLALLRLAFRAHGASRLDRATEALTPDVLAKLGLESRPGIVYVWTETCGQCRTMQAPALDRVTEAMPQVEVVSINAVERSNVASRFGVLTVPTTAVIDSAGSLRAVNHGYADVETLKGQLVG
jgi:thioredoxin-like negative regulator of GroEL